MKKETTVKKKATKEPAVKKPAASTKSRRSSTERSVDKALVKFDPLQRYLTEISNYKLLTREQEKELGIQVREHGDKEAARQKI
jgi:RNA polymerase sigma-32 factor